jgi:hypothetical protein
MARARGYAPFETSEAQDSLLDRIIDTAQQHGDSSVGVFDLDGCLFDTRPRQVLIIREYASETGALDLYRIQATHFKDWDLGNTMRNAGFTEDRIAALKQPLADFWFNRFFRSDYVVHDHAMPGAVDLVRQCRATGMGIVYLTGRDETMRAGTEASLKGFGFPLDGGDCRLLVKPDFKTDDTEFKNDALSVIATMGTPTLFLDNEPANVNRFRERYPDALVVFVETDHSPKPDEPHAEIPWLRSFSRVPR